MRHRGYKYMLSRRADHRQAMLRNMVTSLLKYDRIKTTVIKAKALRPVAERLVTWAKYSNAAEMASNPTAAVRHRMKAEAVVREKEALVKLFEILGPRYEHRPGGYTRVMKIGHRRGDAADMAVIEWVDREGEIRKAKPVNEGTTRRNRGERGIPSATMAAEAGGVDNLDLD